MGEQSGAEGKKLIADYKGQTTPPKPQATEVRIDMAQKHSPGPALPAAVASEQPGFHPTTPPQPAAGGSHWDDSNRPPRRDRPRAPSLDPAVTQQPAPTSTPRMEATKPFQEGPEGHRPPRDESFFSRSPLPVSTPPEHSRFERGGVETRPPALRPQGKPEHPHRDERFFSRPALPATQQDSAQHSPASKPHRDESFFSRPALSSESAQHSPASGASPRPERPHRHESFFSWPALPATQQDSAQHSPASKSKHDGHSGRPDRDEGFFSRPALPAAAVADHPMFDNPKTREHTSLPKTDPSAAAVNMAEDYLSRPAKLPPLRASSSSASRVSPGSEKPHRDEAFFSRPAVSPRQTEKAVGARAKSGRPQRDESFFSRPPLPSSAISEHRMFDRTPSHSRTPSPRSGTPRAGTPPSPGTSHDLAEGYLSRPAKLSPFNSPQPMFPHLNLTSSTDMLASVSEYDTDLAHTPRDDSAHNASGMLRMLDLKPRSVLRSQSLKRETATKGAKASKSEMLSQQALCRTSLLDGQESSAPVKPPSRKLLRTTQW